MNAQTQVVYKLQEVIQLQTVSGKLITLSPSELVVGLSGGSIFRKKKMGTQDYTSKKKILCGAVVDVRTQKKKDSWESGTMRSDRVNGQCERLNVTNYEVVVICADLQLLSWMNDSLKECFLGLIARGVTFWFLLIMS